MITVQSLGGSGEEARNCFYVSSGERHFLLDCGVRREISSIERMYPALSKEIASSLDAVFLSHAHEDHCAALPYLFGLGYRGPVFCSSETMSLARDFMHKWVSYVKYKGGRLPFDEDNVDSLDFQPLEPGDHEIAGIGVLAGRSAHMVGGLWYRLDIAGTTLLYTGDICVDALLLRADELPASDVLVADAAYAARTLDQGQQFAKILVSVKETIDKKGTVLLPVPAQGRGIDLFLYLLHHGVPLMVEPSILKCYSLLKGKDEWIAPSPLWKAQDGFFQAETESGKSLDGFAILCPDGMMTSPVSVHYLEKIKGSYKNKVILSGHVAAGSLGAMIQDPGYRRKESICLEVESTTIKVHPDRNDVMNMVEKVKPSAVMLFHAKAEACSSLVAWLEQRNIRVVCAVSQPLSF